MKQKLISLFLALAMCLGALPVTALAADDTLDYLALGDSITAGYGLSNSSDGFVVKLADAIDATSTTNLGESGWTTAELLSALKSDSDYQDAVKDADVITITIGGNDLMAVLYQCIATLYNGTYGTSLTTTYIQTVLAKPSLDQDVYDNTLDLVAGLSYTQAMSYASSFSTVISATVTNINAIVTQLRTANSDAVILVANQYNPYQWFSSTGDYAMLKTLFSLVVSNFNTALSSGATSDCIVVDVASAFSSSTSSLTNADESTPNLDFHPNAAGHTAIANAMAAAYEKAAADSGSSGEDEPSTPTTETVSVTYNLDGLTSSNEATTHTKGEAYTTILTAADGYSLPDSITVTVGGITLTAGTYYAYNSATGTVALPAAVVLSDIVITASATADDVTAPVISGIADGETYCESVTFTVTDDNLDTVTVDGEPVTEYTLTADDNSHTVVATDKAGNQTTVIVTVNTDHTWDEGTVTTEPTCTDAGVKTYTCIVCGDTKTATVEASGHNYVNGVCTICGAKESTVPAATKITSLTNKAGGVKVVWNTVSGATSYQVYRKIGSGSWKKVKTTSSTTWTDTAAKKNGTKYQYKVYAVNSDGKSEVSATSTIYRLTAKHFTCAKNVSGKKISLKWTRNTKATGYIIEYSTSKSFTSSTTKTVKIKGSKNLTTTLKNLTKGKTYYIRMRPYKTVGSVTSYAGWSKVKTVKVKK